MRIEALDQPDAPARARFVAAACAADAVLQRQVERLLDHHFTDNAFMGTLESVQRSPFKRLASATPGRAAAVCQTGRVG